MITYHDTEYGFPVEENNTIFERLMLEIYQAGLSWKLVMEKREAFNEAFHNYNIEKVAKMTDKDLERLLDNEDIIRNKLKINATRNNARVSLEIIRKYGSLIDFFKTVDYQIVGDPREEYKQTVKQIKKAGYKFIGPLILDEFFKSIGLVEVNHDKECFLHPENL